MKLVNEILMEPATVLLGLIRSGQVGIEELTQASLNRIDEISPVYNPFCTIITDAALSRARELDARRVRGEEIGSLGGLPVAVKDFTPTAGIRTTFGSRIFENHVPERDAVVVQRLRKAGAVLLGKTTTPEFAGSWFTRGALFGVTRNPWNPERSPGGSSGGSAVAVTTGCVALAEGSDMAGSIRGPASFCGIVGMKPGLGRIPVDILPIGSDEFTHLGPLARSVDDAALFLNAVAGPHAADRLSYVPSFKADFMSTSCDGFRVAYSPDLGIYSVDSEVAAAVQDAANELGRTCGSIGAVKLSWRPEFVDAFFESTFVWMAALYGDFYDTDFDKLDPITSKSIELGRMVDAVKSKRLDFVRAEVWRSLAEIFDRYDVLICPTMALPAPGLDRDDFDYGRRDGQGKLISLDMTSLFNLVGSCPAISVPVGATTDGLPIGLQIVGPPYREDIVLGVARRLESLRPRRIWESSVFIR